MVNLTSMWSSSFICKEREIRHLLLLNLSKQLHLNADLGTSIRTLSFAFWAAAAAFYFLGLNCDLSYTSPCKAERNAFRKQKVSELTCPTSLSICMLLFSRKCPEPISSSVTEKNVVSSCLKLYLERCQCMTFRYMFSWWGKQGITILISITNDIVPWPILIHIIKHAISVLILTELVVIWWRFLWFRKLVLSSFTVLLGDLWQVTCFNVLVP